MIYINGIFSTGYSEWNKNSMEWQTSVTAREPLNCPSNSNQLNGHTKDESNLNCFRRSAAVSNVLVR